MSSDAPALRGECPPRGAGVPTSARMLLLGSAAFLLVAFNLRGPMASVPPVADEIGASLGVSGAVVGMVTTLPLLCFAIAAPVSPLLARRWRVEPVILAALAVILAGVLLRAVFGVGWLLAGTLVAGVGIAVVNVLLPSVIKDWYPRPGLMTGLYGMAMGVGGAVGAAVVIPMERALGGWVPALACWAVLVVAAMVAWWPFARAPRAVVAPEERRPNVLREPVGWVLAGMFGCATLLAFSGFAWLPSIATHGGMSAEVGASFLTIYLLVGVPAAITVPLLVQRRIDRRSLAVWLGAAFAGGLLGLLLAPPAWMPACVVALGIAQGGGFSLVMALVVVRSVDGHHAVALSGMTQGIGYVIASLGPTLIGALHDATGTWTASLAVLLVVAVLFVVLGQIAGRPVRFTS